MRAFRLGFYLALVWLIHAGPVQPAHSSGRLVLYLSQEEGGAPGVTLEGVRLQLVGSSDPVEIPLHVSAWSSEGEFPSMNRIAECEIPVGTYTGLQVRLASVTAPVGVAPVHPAIPDSLVLPMRIEAIAGQVSLCVVHWKPRAVEELDHAYDPGLVVTEPSFPPPGGSILVSNEESGTVTILDRWALDPRAEIDVGGGPRDMVWSKLRQRLYVALAEDDAVAIIDLVSHRKENETSVHAGDEPSRLLIDEENSRLFVLNTSSSTVSILDSGSLQEVDRLVVEPSPMAFAYDRRRGRLYVSSRVRDGVIVYDLDGGQEPWVWRVEGGAGELLFDADRDHLIVASLRQRKLLVLDAASGTVLQRIDLCSCAKGLALIPSNGEIAAAASRCREISFALFGGEMETDRVRTPSDPGLLVADPASSTILAVLPGGNELAVVNIQSRRLSRRVPVGRKPFGVLAP